MTSALDAAVARLATLPPDEQDRVASWLLEELRDNERWNHQFDGSQDALSDLAGEAREDRDAGRATNVPPKRL